MISSFRIIFKFFFFSLAKNNPRTQKQNRLRTEAWVHDLFQVEINCFLRPAVGNGRMEGGRRIGTDIILRLLLFHSTWSQAATNHNP